MTEPTEYPDVDLPDNVDPDGAGLPDHPEALTDAEAEEGHAVYMAVDDTDDESNGLDQ